MKVKITKEDIKKGIRRDSKFCPIARALKKNYPAYSNIKVGLQAIIFKYGPYRTHRYLRVDGLIFISKFDNGQEVEPTEIELGVPV